MLHVEEVQKARKIFFVFNIYEIRATTHHEKATPPTRRDDSDIELRTACLNIPLCFSTTQTVPASDGIT